MTAERVKSTFNFLRNVRPRDAVCPTYRCPYLTCRAAACGDVLEGRLWAVGATICAFGGGPENPFFGQWCATAIGSHALIKLLHKKTAPEGRSLLTISAALFDFGPVFSKR